MDDLTHYCDPRVAADLPLIDQISVINACRDREVLIELLKVLWRSVRLSRDVIDRRSVMYSQFYQYNTELFTDELKKVYGRVRDLRLRGLIRYLYEYVDSSTVFWTWHVDRQPFQVEEIYTYLTFKYGKPYLGTRIDSSLVQELGLGIREAYSTIDSDDDDDGSDDDSVSGFEDRISSDTEFMVANVNKMLSTVTYNAVSCLNVFEAMAKFLQLEDLVESIVASSLGCFEFIRGVIMGRVIKYGVVDRKLYERLYQAEGLINVDELRDIITVLSETGVRNLIGNSRVEWREAIRRRFLGQD